MKKIKWLLVIVMIITAIAGYSQVQDKETMVKQVFSVLKNKDEQGYIKLFPDAATMKELMSMIAKSDTTGDLQDMMKILLDKITDSSLQIEFSGEFKKTIKMGEEKGVDWSQANLVSYKADSTLTKKDGIEVSKLTGKIYFNVGSKEYFLKFNEVIWFEREGWYGVDIERIDEKSKEHDDSGLAWQGYGDSVMVAVDSLRLVADSVANARENKPVQKAKQPVKNKPGKSKTQSPAHKRD